MRNKLATTMLLCAALSPLAGCGSDDSSKPANSHSSSPSHESSSGSAQASSSPGVDSSKSPAKVKAAKADAEQFIKTIPASKAWLIDMISERGEAEKKYSRQDVTTAVNSMKVDWNEQAVKQANLYLQVHKFSCSELEQQLALPDASKFTAAQAKYGAQHSPACAK